MCGGLSVGEEYIYCDVWCFILILGILKFGNCDFFFKFFFNWWVFLKILSLVFVIVVFLFVFKIVILDLNCVIFCWWVCFVLVLCVFCLSFFCVMSWVYWVFFLVVLVLVSVCSLVIVLLYFEVDERWDEG